MQKAEYRYYEISRDIPVLVLTGEKWETIYGTDNMHFHNYLEIGYCHYGKGTVQLADRELTYDVFVKQKSKNSLFPSKYTCTCNPGHDKRMSK